MNVPCPLHFMTKKECTDACLRPMTEQMVLMVEFQDYWQSHDWRLQYEKYKQYFRTHYLTRIAA